MKSTFIHRTITWNTGYETGRGAETSVCIPLPKIQRFRYTKVPIPENKRYSRHITVNVFGSSFKVSL